MVVSQQDKHCCWSDWDVQGCCVMVMVTDCGGVGVCVGWQVTWTDQTKSGRWNQRPQFDSTSQQQISQFSKESRLFLSTSWIFSKILVSYYFENIPFMVFYVHVPFRNSCNTFQDPLTVCLSIIWTRLFLPDYWPSLDLQLNFLFRVVSSALLFVAVWFWLTLTALWWSSGRRCST